MPEGSGLHCMVSTLLFLHVSSQEHSLVDKLFGPLRLRYMARPGGYTRLLHIPNRQGDNAKMAVIELVDNG